MGRECSHFIDEKGEAQRESALRSVPPQTLLLGFSSLLGEVQEEVLAWWGHWGRQTSAIISCLHVPSLPFRSVLHARGGRPPDPQG